MLRQLKIATLCAALALSGCALFHKTPPVGATAAEVVAARGQPSSIYPVADGQIYEYATGPMGQFTWFARIGADGRMSKFEQVLTGEEFAKIKINHAKKDDVLRTIGRPSERSRVASHDYEVWSYRYKENVVWNSMMHIHFDKHGVVRQMLNGPDPLFETKDRSSR